LRATGHFRTRYAKPTQADAVQQGQTDGRGPLSELGLTRFCRFVLDTAVDQVEYISGLLDLQSMKHRIEGYVVSRNDLKPAAKWVLYQGYTSSVKVVGT
jgi:hypothetical protein